AAAPLARQPGPLSPAVRTLIAEHDLDPTTIPASGKGGRLTKGDVLTHLERSETPAAAAAVARPADGPAPRAARGGAPQEGTPPPPPGARRAPRGGGGVSSPRRGPRASTAGGAAARW